jgi:imidazole glycerol-phosphate synthase subunit HisF
VGDPEKLSERYYQNGIDEIIYMDAVASLYGRNNLQSIVSKVARKIFIPLTVGGGIRKSDDVQNLLSAGADKVAINTAAIKNPDLIKELSHRYGSQCIVLSIEAKQISHDKWEPLMDHGREHSGLDVIMWARRCVELGAGEILLTSIDREGTRKGFDIELCKKVTEAVPVPVIVSGGMDQEDDLVKVVVEGCADAVAMADILHFQRKSLWDIRKSVQKHGIKVRDES